MLTAQAAVSLQVEYYKLCLRDLNELGIAISMYAYDCGHPPHALSNLTPMYLKKIRTCPFQGRTYCYSNIGQAFTVTCGSPGDRRGEAFPRLIYKGQKVLHFNLSLGKNRDLFIYYKHKQLPIRLPSEIKV
jgi:hypothetical protein